MVMPSFESYGFAFCEASAFGLPSLCMDIGGVPVVDGVNGFAFPPEANVDAYVDCILEHRNDAKKYNALSKSARAYYEKHLNWGAWARSVKAKIIESRAGL